MELLNGSVMPQVTKCFPSDASRRYSRTLHQQSDPEAQLTGAQPFECGAKQRASSRFAPDLFGLFTTQTTVWSLDRSLTPTSSP